MISAVRLAPYGHQPFFDTLSPSTRAALLMTAVVLVLAGLYKGYRLLVTRQLQRQVAYADRDRRITEAKTYSTCSQLCMRSWAAQRYLAKVQVPAEYAAVVAGMATDWQKCAEVTLARQRTLHSNDYHFSIPRGSAAGMVFPRECYRWNGLSTGFTAASTTYISDYDTDSDTLDYDPWPHHNVDGTPMIQGTMLDIHGDSFGTPSAFNSFDE